MPTEPTNFLVVMSDEHTRNILGCYGNKHVKTPNMDRLAARGTLFRNAYTPCPICVPCRASFATGDYVHRIGHWDNAFPYYGEPPSWGRDLQQAGHRVDSIGKLHYRNPTDPVGFDVQEIPLHVVDGVGDLLGAVREPLPVRNKVREMAEKIGPGESGYTRYDRDIRTAAVKWLEDRAKEGGQSKPWTVFVSMVAPHFPLIAPEAFYDLYGDLGLMPTKPVPEPDHPWFEAQRACMPYDSFTPEKTRIALASYYGLVSFVDDNLGMILDALEATGLDKTTRVIYISDHGDNVGERGLWGKSNMFEESVGVPAILAGPGIPQGRVCETGVNLTDVHPTILESMGLAAAPNKPGRSLIDIANAPDDTDRVVFSEYHAAGAMSGAFMIRKGHYKYVHYTGLEPQLFDLAEDPRELVDIAGRAASRNILSDLETELRKICAPEAVDAQAKADQAALVERHGGRDAVIARGSFGGTPAPGEKANFG